jgi:NAD(P)-dependent dehydrogenase (short-subunit alcohol dehydrogenase family)
VSTSAGKVAIVTGSTQGLGEAIARRLVDEELIDGLVICGRTTENGERLAREFSERGCRTQFVRADLARVDDCRRIAETARREFDRIDFLVNSAATSERGGILDTTPELLDRIFAINLRAPFFLMQAAIQTMLVKNITGSILNILSMSSHGGQPFLAPYSSSKGALATLTRNVACAMRTHRIRVNGLNIGWMDSPAEHAIQKKCHGASDDWLQKAESEQPFGRLLKPAEVAEVAAFLLSDRSGLMTGSIIDFDQHVIGTHD